MKKEDIKIIERVSKKDAYESVYLWGLSDLVSKKEIMWYLKQKIAGHSSFLKQENKSYDYKEITEYSKNKGMFVFGDSGNLREEK